MPQIEDWEKDPHMLENLKDHVPYLPLGGFTGWRNPENQVVVLERYPVQMLIFENPRDSTYRMIYTKVGDTLFVTGDVGEATYRFPGTNPRVVDIEWISKCNLDYFHAKCTASEVGKDFVEWGEQRAKKRLEENLRNMHDLEFDELTVNNENGASEYPDEYLKTKEEIERLGGYDVLYNKDEWNQWLAENGYDVFGERYVALSSIGTEINVRCIYHLLGLKLAFARLGENKDKEKNND